MIQWNVKLLVVQSCPPFWEPMDCSTSGSSVHGVFQERILQWVAIPFSKGSSWLRDRTQVSCIAGRLFTVWATREPWELTSTPRHGNAWALWPREWSGRRTISQEILQLDLSCGFWTHPAWHEKYSHSLLPISYPKKRVSIRTIHLLLPRDNHK